MIDILASFSLNYLNVCKASVALKRININQTKLHLKQSQSPSYVQVTNDNQGSVYIKLDI